MMNGNSGSGVAIAGAEKAMAPIASAPKATARQEFNFNASRLNMAVPCLIAFAPVRRSFRELSPGKGFRRFASKPQNGFVGVGNCFVLVSLWTGVVNLELLRGPRTCDILSKSSNRGKWLMSGGESGTL